MHPKAIPLLHSQPILPGRQRRFTMCDRLAQILVFPDVLLLGELLTIICLRNFDLPCTPLI